jgi:hypothetical protein
MSEAPGTVENEPAPARAPWRARALRSGAFLLGLVVLLAFFFRMGQAAYLTRERATDRKEVGLLGNVDAIVLGSSHGFTIVADLLGKDGVNLAHPGQDLFEVAYIGRAAKARAPRLKTVVIELAYFSFVFDHAAFVKKGVRTRVARRFNMYASFARFGFIEGDASEYAKGLLWPLVTDDHFRDGFAFIGSFERVAHALLKGADAGEPKSARREQQAPPKTKTARYFKRDAVLTCKEYDELTSVMRRNHPKLEDDTWNTLLELVREFEADGLKVVLVSTPALPDFNECFDRRWQKLMRKSARRITQKTKAKYYDFSADPAWQNPELFRDSHHLLSTSREAFTRALVAAMAKP